MIRVIIADDHNIVREGIKKILALSDDITFVAEAVNGNEVLNQLAVHSECDLLLLDMTMPHSSGIELIEQVRGLYPSLPILIFSMHNEPQVVTCAIRAGASGFIFKGSEPEILLTAIRRVGNGGRYIDPSIAEQIAFESLLPEPKDLHINLSSRELEVMRQLVGGRRIKDIAEEMIISNKTVSTHKLNLLQKLKLKSTADMVRYAVEHKMFLQY